MRHQIGLRLICKIAWIAALAPWSVSRAEFTERSGEPPLTVSGNSRTNDRYISKLFSTCLNRYIAVDEHYDVKELEQCMLNTRLFSEVSVARVDEDTWHLHVKERWTLIIAPYFESTSEDETAYGLIAVESNFLGIGNFLLMSTTFRSGDSNIVIRYRDTGIALTNWRLHIDLEQRNDTIPLSEKVREIDLLNERMVRFGIGPGYNITKHNLTMSLSLFSEEKTYRDTTHHLAPDSYIRTPLEALLLWDASNYQLYFEQGYSGALAVKSDILRSDDNKKASSSTANIQWQQSYWLQHAIQTKFLVGASTTNLKTDALRLGNQRGFRGTRPNSI